MTTGERISYCRLEKHMTQKELGEKAGIDPSTIRKYESGRLNPKIGTLRKIADALGCKVTDLDSTLVFQEITNEVIKKASPDLPQRAEEWMKAIYGTSDKDEAQRVVFLRWEKSLYDEDRENVYKVLKNLQKLNSNGKQIAAERVEELTQIPKYQKAPTENSTQSVEDKEPEQR